MRLQSSVLIAIAIVLLAHAAHGAIPPAGYEIRSRSRGEYYLGSELRVSFSNEIVMRVLPLFGVDIAPDGTPGEPAYELQGYGGDTLYCAFTLTNAGNAWDSLGVDHSIAASPSFAPRGVLLFSDLDADGRYDPGEEDPFYLSLASGESAVMTVGVILPDQSSFGECALEIRVFSTHDENAEDVRVVNIAFLGPATNLLHIGPESNPKALPGGDASADDITVIVPAIRQTAVEFINEILSEHPGPDVVSIALARGATLPPGLRVTFHDTTGSALPRTSAESERFVLGVLDPGETRKVTVRVATGGDPLFSVIGRSLAIPVVARSLVDTSRFNATFDVIDAGTVSLPPAVITLQQTFKQPVAGAGDIVTMIVTVKNISDSVAVDSLVVSEFVQPSLEFLGSADFSHRDGLLIWRAGGLPGGMSKSTAIKFMCTGRVSRGTVKAVGHASGVSEFGGPVEAGPVVSVLGIENDVFSAEGVVLGDVYIDANGDRRRDDGEEGVPGVAVYLESGEYALADSLGKFSLPRAFSGYRVVRLDESSLPAWVERPQTDEVEHGSAWHTRIVHLLEGGHAVVSFPFKRLIEKAQPAYLKEQAVDGLPVVDDSKAGRQTTGPAAGGAAPGAGRNAEVDGGTSLCRFVSPFEASVFSKRDRITVQTRVPLGSEYVLSCNGAVVSHKNIGEKVIELRKRYEEVFWYGVRLTAGWNEITLSAKTVDGTRLADTLHVALAGRPTALECERKRVLVPADGRTGAVVRFAVRDQYGLPAVDGLAATVIEGDSLVSNRDARPDRHGLQVTSGDGYFTVDIRASNATGRKNIVLRLDDIDAACSVAFVPPERAFFMSGIVDTKLGINNAWGTGNSQGLDEFHDGAQAKNASRLFVQGTTYGGMNLTIRLDSNKRYEDPLLKTLSPERGYPIYGDASQLHYAAPSQGGNYVALEKGESFVRYGDFRTPFTGGEFLSYKRAATGVNAALTRGDRTIKGFLTKSDFTTVKDELPGDGTSGYYYLTRVPMVEFSEKIVLETRERYQPEKIVSIEPLIQNRDYTINYLDGAVLFKEPVPVTDARFNPVIIVALYEVGGRDTRQKSKYLYGLSGDIARSPGARLQMTAVGRESDGKGYTLFGTNGSVVVKGIRFLGEAARSEDEIAGAGNAFKVEGAFSNERAEGSLYFRRVDGDFLNPSFTGSAHELASIKAGYEATLNMSPSLSLKSLGYRQRFFQTGERRENIDALMGYENGGLRAEGGIRAAGQERNRIAENGFLAIIGAGYEKTGAGFATRWEKNVLTESVDDYPDRLRTTMTVNFLKRYRMVVNHEYLTAASRGATHQAHVGVESRINAMGTAYTKYSMNRTAGDERLGAILGLKQQFKVSERLSGNFTIENFHSLSGNREEDYFSLQTGLGALKRRSYLVEGQYEHRWQRRAVKHLFRLNGSKELQSGKSLLFKQALSYQTADERDEAVSYDGRVGFAFRPDHSPFQQLLMVKNTYERFTPVNPDAVTWKLVCSSDLNYRPGAGREVRIKYAIKYVEDYCLGASLEGRSQLILAQFIHRFARRWDLDVWGRVLHHSNGTTGTGAGLECGVMLWQCVRLAGGYSVNGFEERDMAQGDAWANGFGLRVQLLLSEWILNEVGL